MHKEQLISIIIPCYNQSEFLDETLSSIFKQTYENWECLIINDESPDNTEEIANRWVKKDCRFKYFLKKNGGVSSARNFGLEKAIGDYIQFLDSDDLISNIKLELSVELMNNNVNENGQIVFTNFRMFTNNEKITSEPYCILNQEIFTYENLLYEWNEIFSIPIHTALIKKTLLHDIRFPEHMTAQEDWIFWVKLFKNNPKALFIDQDLVLYRLNLSSRTLSRNMLEDELKAYDYFKEILNEDEFNKLSTILISRYYRKSIHFVKKYNETKSSNTYFVGKIIKKGLQKIYLLNFAKAILKKIIS
jgi:glycosyltransferase involved in cell wall biosynthesis